MKKKIFIVITGFGLVLLITGIALFINYALPGGDNGLGDYATFMGGLISTPIGVIITLVGLYLLTLKKK